MVATRRGGVYLAVLGVAVFVAATGVGLMYAVRLQGATDAAIADTAQARLCAEAGVEAAAQYISSNSNWRTRGQGVWMSALALGSGSVTVAVSDPDDGNLADNANHPIVIRATGAKGTATHILEVRATPRGASVSSLGVALAAVGQLRVNSGVTFNVGSSSISTNTVLRNDGLVQGSARCSTSTGTGTATLGTSTGAAALAMPPSGIITRYINLGTPITPATTTLNKVLLTPAFNSLSGGTNADGVYVINSTSDLSIGSIRVQGTLIINCPGRRVSFTGPAFLQPARPDYPTLIVNGDVVLSSSSAAVLSETTDGYNYNPRGASYGNTSDTDTIDVYPSRIEGLVHVSGTVELSNNQHISGTLISESTSTSDAVRVIGPATINYSSSLSTSPPLGYTSGGTPAMDMGSWKQVVLP